VLLSPRLPPIAALEVLLTIARTGSLSQAAREVGVSQQAISSRIRALEAQTGVPLVSRTAHGSTLTPAGVVVAGWADRLVDVARELDAGLAALRDDRRARLRISASLTIAEQLLPGWLVSQAAAARRRGEEPAEVVLTATNSVTVIDRVRSGDADLGFTEGPTIPKGLRSKVIGHDELVVVVRPDHPWARRRQPVTPTELAGTPLVSREEGSGTRQALTVALANALGAATAGIPVALVLSTTSAVRAAVVAGAGPAVLSELAVSDDLASGRLARVSLVGIDLRRTLRAVWVGSRVPPAGAARDLLGHVTSQARRST
jgi:molybdate transport repressor ModE-like protein